MKKTILSTILAVAFLAGAGDVNAGIRKNRSETKKAFAVYSEYNLVLKMRNLEANFDILKKTTTNKNVKTVCTKAKEMASKIRENYSFSSMQRSLERFKKAVTEAAKAAIQQAKENNETNAAIEVILATAKDVKSQPNGNAVVNQICDAIIDAFEGGSTATAVIPATTSSSSSSSTTTATAVTTTPATTSSSSSSSSSTTTPVTTTSSSSSSSRRKSLWL